MTSQTSKNRYGWRRAVTGTVTSSALAVGLLVGVGAPTAMAQPDPETPSETDAPPVTANGDVLTAVYAEYATGAGGGHVSNWIKESMQLRALGFRPSKGNLEDIQDALTKRPNQTPLVDALKETVAYQRKLQAQSQAAVAPGGFTAGINQLPPGQQADPTDPDNTGVFIGPSGGIQQPVG